MDCDHILGTHEDGDYYSDGSEIIRASGAFADTNFTLRFKVCPLCAEPLPAELDLPERPKPETPPPGSLGDLFLKLDVRPPPSYGSPWVSLLPKKTLTDLSSL